AKHVAAPAVHERKQPWSEVARGIDGVPGIEPEGGADQEDQQADDDRRQPGRRRRVPSIGDREDDADQQGRPDHLIDEAAGKHAQKRLGIGRPDTRRSLRADDVTARPQAMLIDSVLPAAPLLRTTCATTPTPKTIRMNVPKNSARSSLDSALDMARIVDSSG